MSKASSPIKVLRTAYRRVEKGWTQNQWYYFDRMLKKVFVCLEGGVYGYCDSSKHNVTPEQAEAIRVLKEIIKERYGIDEIPAFNDIPGRTQEEVLETIKLAIIRLETDQAIEEMEDEDFEDILAFRERKA